MKKLIVIAMVMLLPLCLQAQYQKELNKEQKIRMVTNITTTAVTITLMAINPIAGVVSSIISITGIVILNDWQSPECKLPRINKKVHKPKRRIKP